MHQFLQWSGMAFLFLLYRQFYIVKRVQVEAYHFGCMTGGTTAFYSAFPVTNLQEAHVPGIVVSIFQPAKKALPAISGNFL
jgi:hypothetical protein